VPNSKNLLKFLENDHNDPKILCNRESTVFLMMESEPNMKNA